MEPTVSGAWGAGDGGGFEKREEGRKMNGRCSKRKKAEKNFLKEVNR